MSKLQGKTKAKARKKKRDQSKKSLNVHIKQLLEKIRKFDDPILEQACLDVRMSDNLGFITILKQVISYTKNGIGLSAPQIGVLKNVFVLRLDLKKPKIQVMINPVILYYGKETEAGVEGCLSYPGFQFNIVRHKEISVSYLNEKFNCYTRDFSGFQARVIQHEVDHLSGKCLVGDHWEKQKTLR